MGQGVESSRTNPWGKRREGAESGLSGRRTSERGRKRETTSKYLQLSRHIDKRLCFDNSEEGVVAQCAKLSAGMGIWLK